LTLKVRSLTTASSESVMSGPVPAEQAPEPRSVWLSRSRVLLFAGLFLAEFAIFLLGLLTPLDPNTQHTLANQTGTQFSFIQNATAPQIVFFIFEHNLGIALVELIPIFGALFFLFSMYTTGLATQAIVGASGHPGAFGLVLFTLPYSFVELSAYAISVGAGTMLLVAWRRKRLGKELRYFALEVVLLAAVLFTAATMETLTTYSVVIGLALWIPTGLAMAGIVVLWARRAH
jgi:hypothetical protein